uniref:GATA transcription factor 4-like n=1 Tax=Erigeron canadensis TaxID=72917 RepID=UPI001CB8F980|nr:GATA transcription factor 4-like [Erigeron canadensis]
MDTFIVEELFDFSVDEDGSIKTMDDVVVMNQDMISSSSSCTTSTSDYSFHNNTTADFTDHFFVPIEDAEELEWLSTFVEDSFTNFPSNNITGTINYQPENPSFHSRSRSKRTRAPSHNSSSWTSSLPQVPTSASSRETKSQNNVVRRRCTHCASEKTPQWRTGPLGPKTLCNACGVRYKSGRLVPEYRPAASPTFVLTQHSNSHRKVMELRRQKETMMSNNIYHQQLLSSEQQTYRHHGSNHGVC